MTKNKSQNAVNISRLLFWIMVLSSVGILGISYYNLTTNNEPIWLQLGLVAAILSTAISTSDFQILSKNRKLILSAVLVLMALGSFIISIGFSI